MLVELSVVEQRYHAVMEVVCGGIPVVEVAERYGVSRKTVHAWLGRYRQEGLPGLTGRSHRPHHHPGQLAAEVEARVCELRRTHPRWGPRRLVYELRRRGVDPLPSRSTVYRVLVRHGLVSAIARKRRRQDYRRWERSGPMQLWQLDVMGSVLIRDPSAAGGVVEAKLISGIDDHSRYAVIAKVVPRATARAVCTAFVSAMAEYGVPEEVLSDNGKQFTGRFGAPRPAEVLFERICRHNGITQRLTKPRSPTTTGKVERWHQSIQGELLDPHGPFARLGQAVDQTQQRRLARARWPDHGEEFALLNGERHPVERPQGAMGLAHALEADDRAGRHGHGAGGGVRVWCLGRAAARPGRAIVARLAGRVPGLSWLWSRAHRLYHSRQWRLRSAMRGRLRQDSRCSLRHSLAA